MIASTSYTYKPTTALKKISKLIKRVEDIAIIQGGGGAGKTVGIEMLIIDWFNRNPDKQITICSHERTKLMDTAFLDFKKILIDYGLWNYGKWNENKSRWVFNHSNTGFIEFIGLDKSDIGKGRRRDLIYINEANKINHDKYVDISLRARKCIIDYNSDYEFWAHEYKTKDNFISLTFLDNEYIPEEEKRNLLSYRDKAFHDIEAEDLFNPKNIKNEYFSNLWKVYGLGLDGGLSGQILRRWKEGAFDDSLPYVFGVDWGYTDPFTLTKVAVNHDKRIIYVKELAYQSGLSMSQIHKIVSSNCSIDEIIVCDSAEPMSIKYLRDRDYNAVEAWKPKGSIVTGLRWLQDYLIILDDSPNIANEMKNYIWAERRSETPIDKFNHAIDGIRYGYAWLRMNYLQL